MEVFRATRCNPPRTVSHGTSIFIHFWITRFDCRANALFYVLWKLSHKLILHFLPIMQLRGRLNHSVKSLYNNGHHMRTKKKSWSALIRKHPEAWTVLVIYSDLPLLLHTSPGGCEACQVVMSKAFPWRHSVLVSYLGSSQLFHVELNYSLMCCNARIMVRVKKHKRLLKSHWPMALSELKSYSFMCFNMHKNIIYWCGKRCRSPACVLVKSGQPQ